LLRFGQWFRAVTPAIILGMLTGFAVIIFAGQFHVMLDDAPGSSTLENLRTIPAALSQVVFPGDGDRHVAGWLGLGTIAILIVWPRIAPARLKLLPGALLAVILATVVAEAGGLPVARIDIPDQLWSAVAFPGTDALAAALSGPLLGV